MSPNAPPKVVKQFLNDENIKQISLGQGHWDPADVQANDTFRPVTDELAKRALETILDSNHHPLIVLCKTGVHQTGTVIACLRRMMDWGLTATLDEHHTIAGSIRTHHANELFIELFDVDLVSLPDRSRVPQWLLCHWELTEKETTAKDRRDSKTKQGSLILQQQQGEKVEAPNLLSEQNNQHEEEARETAVPPAPQNWTSVPHPSRILSSGNRNQANGKILQTIDKVTIRNDSGEGTDAAHEPAYEQFLLSPNAPLISSNVTFSFKRSIAQDDDD